MTGRDTLFNGKPTTADEVIRSIMWPGWHPVVAFQEGSKNLLNLKPRLIRESLILIKERSDLCRYTRAISEIVHISQPDDDLKVQWKTNLRLLRALLRTSPCGTPRQRTILLEISRNARVVGAMRQALRQEIEIQPRSIEPSWIAVLYSEGSKESVREADRFNAFLDSKLQAALLTYLGESKRQS